MSQDKYESIRLKNQMCFPLYVCSKEIVRRHKPYLDKLELTYTQYITMMVLWEKKEVTVKELGKDLFLDSGTLTPLLKKLESKGYVTRERMEHDERNLCVKITKEGDELQEKALQVPKQMKGCISLKIEEAEQLSNILHKILGEFQE